MKRFRPALLVVAIATMPALPASAQLTGEVSPPRTYDPVGDMQYTARRWAPTERVREVQQVLRDKGYYTGPLDGVMNPAFTRAIWNFQHDKRLPRSARLDAPTMAALEIPATGVASPGAAPSFGASAESSRVDEMQAP